MVDIHPVDDGHVEFVEDQALGQVPGQLRVALDDGDRARAPALVRRREFVGAAVAMGLTNRQIIFSHIIPNTVGPVVVFVTLLVPQVILLESFLSFLGLGVQEPLTSWGLLIAEGAGAIESSLWLLLYPAIFFVVTLTALNFIGDGLRDAFDPKDR